MIVDLGRTEAVIPREHQSRAERYTQGERVRGVLVDVHKNPKGAQIVLSRTAPELLMRLMEMEVPEIYDGTVVIRGCVRQPGDRAKVAVSSRERDVDPVGACVGMRGARVQAIMRELRGERIDIIQFSDDLVTYAQNALSPAKITRVSAMPADEEEQEVGPDGEVVEPVPTLECIVEEDQLSLAIGKRGPERPPRRRAHRRANRDQERAGRQGRGRRGAPADDHRLAAPRHRALRSPRPRSSRRRRVRGRGLRDRRRPPRRGVRRGREPARRRRARARGATRPSRPCAPSTRLPEEEPEEEGLEFQEDADAEPGDRGPEGEPKVKTIAAKFTVAELAKMMGKPPKEVLFLLQGIGVDVKTVESVLDAATATAILTGKTQAPKTLIVRQTPAAPSAAALATAAAAKAKTERAALKRIKIVEKSPEADAAEGIEGASAPEPEIAAAPVTEAAAPESEPSSSPAGGRRRPGARARPRSGPTRAPGATPRTGRTRRPRGDAHAVRSPGRAAGASRCRRRRPAEPSSVFSSARARCPRGPRRLRPRRPRRRPCAATRCPPTARAPARTPPASRTSAPRRHPRRERPRPPHRPSAAPAASAAP